MPNSWEFIYSQIYSLLPLFSQCNLFSPVQPEAGGQAEASRQLTTAADRGKSKAAELEKTR